MPSLLATRIAAQLGADIAATVDEHLDKYKPPADIYALKTEYNAVQAGVKSNLRRLISIRRQLAIALNEDWPANGPTTDALNSALQSMTPAKSFAGVPFEENPT